MFGKSLLKRQCKIVGVTKRNRTSRVVSPLNERRNGNGVLITVVSSSSKVDNTELNLESAAVRTGTSTASTAVLCENTVRIAKSAGLPQVVVC